MDEPMVESPFAIKWRDDVENNCVSCYVGPTAEPDPTDDWISILTVNRQILEDDREFYEALLTATGEWMKRIFADAGIDKIEMVRFEGGVPPMDGAS